MRTATVPDNFFVILADVFDSQKKLLLLLMVIDG